MSAEWTAWYESLLADWFSGRYLVVEERIMVVLSGRSLFRHTCLVSDVAWRDSCQHRQGCGLRWSHASGDNSHGVIQCNVQRFSVGAAAPDRWSILSGTVDKRKRTRPQGRGVRSTAGASQTRKETVPGIDVALEAFKMFCVRQAPVESHAKVNRVVIVRKRDGAPFTTTSSCRCVSLLFRRNAVVVVLTVLSFRRMRLRYSDRDCMSWFGGSSTFSQVWWAANRARSSALPYCFDVVFGMSLT